ncbi:pyrrolo-quinoline quinone [Stutzerimonas degradans]|nr:pyrrolo-quinoline quinone [Stutzerimonas degradans]
MAFSQPNKDAAMSPRSMPRLVPLALAIHASCVLAAPLPDQAWPQHGLDAAETRFSPLAQIDRSNVSRLGLAWQFRFDRPRGVQGTPLMVGETLYVSGPWGVVYALDARNGELRWQHDPLVPAHKAAVACCDVVNRGVAVAHERVFVGTLDGRLQALDAHSGELLWSTQTTPPERPYTITGAPRVVGDLVMIGNGGAEYGVRGYLSAYDAASGELRWRFYTVPGDPAEGADGEVSDEPLKNIALPTWTGQWWLLGGGGTVWDSMAYDPELDLLYFGVGNGSPHDRDLRSPEGGDNLFLSSIVAVHAKTGEYAWHYQTTPGDSWDYTATQHMILAELRLDGRQRKVLMQAPKKRLLLRARPRDRRAAERGQLRAHQLGQPCGPSQRPARRSAGRALPCRPACGRHAVADRRAQLAADGLEPAHRAGLHPGAGKPGVYGQGPAISHRTRALEHGYPGPSPTDRCPEPGAGAPGHAWPSAGLGSGAPARGLAQPATGDVERWRADHRRPPGVSGPGWRRPARVRCREWEAAVAERHLARHPRRADQLSPRRRAVHRRRRGLRQFDAPVGQRLVAAPGPGGQRRRVRLEARRQGTTARATGTTADAAAARWHRRSRYAATGRAALHALLHGLPWRGRGRRSGHSGPAPLGLPAECRGLPPSAARRSTRGARHALLCRQPGSSSGRVDSRLCHPERAEHRQITRWCNEKTRPRPGFLWLTSSRTRTWPPG